MIRVLHVDDDFDESNILNYHVKKSGLDIEMTWADTVDKALRLLEEQSFDCILSDFQMPGKDGLEFLEILKKEENPLPFIFLTGQGNEELAAEALRAGADDYFTKNQSFAHFERLLNSIVKHVKLHKSMEEKKEAEAARLASEEQLRTLINATPDIICFKDGEGRWLQANKADIDLFGLHDTDFQGKTDRELAEYSPIHREALLTCDKTDEKAWKRGSISIEEETIPTPEGEERIYEVIKNPVFNDDGSRKGLIVLGRDITERKKTEELLRRSQERYRILVENQLDLVVKVDIEGRFLYVSPSYCRTFGKTEDELLGNTFMPLVHEDDREKTAKAMESLYSPPHTAYVEQRALTVEGWRWFAWNDTSILDEEGNVTAIIGVGRDITMQKRAEEKLIESEEKYRAMYNYSPQAFQSLDEDGTIIDVNPYWLATLGYSRDEVVGKPFSSFLHPEDREAMQAAFAEFKRKGELHDVEFRLRKKNGSYSHVNYEGKIGYNRDGDFKQTYCVFKDISAQKQARESTLQYVDKLSALIDNTGESLWSIDTEYRLIICNAVYRNNIIRWRGQPFEPGDNVLVRSNDDSLYNEWKGYYDRALEGESFTVIRKNSLVPEKKGRYEEFSFSPIIGSDDTVQGATVYGRDISDFITIEEKLKQVNQRLAEANSELESFGLSIAHDLKSPVRQISGFVDLLKLELSDSIEAEGERIMANINQSCRNLTSLVDTLFGFTRLQKAELNQEELELSNIARRIADDLRSGETDREVEFLIEDNLTAKGDQNLIRIMLENLFENAWKYTSHKETAHIRFTRSEENGKQVFTIADNGIGFNQDDAEIIFQPFKRLHSQEFFEGSGIGLATVKKIVHRHGGMVWAEAEMNKGTSIHFTLGNS